MALMKHLSATPAAWLPAADFPTRVFPFTAETQLIAPHFGDD